MGLLDDLRNQSDEQRVSEAEGAERDATREKFYDESIKPRMLKAYKFFTELAEHLNYLAEKTSFEYPLLNEGGLVPLLQSDYAVVVDSSTQIKNVDLKFTAALQGKYEYEIFGKDAVLLQEDRLQRYSFKHDCKHRKDKNNELESAKVILIGPMYLKINLMVDLQAETVVLTMRNFTDPGSSRYILKPEQLDDGFLDRVGKYLLRKETSLFGNGEMSDEAKQQLRDKLQADQIVREKELREAEKMAAEQDELEKTQTAKEQIKKNIADKVTENKKKLKTLFNKLKQQAGFDKQD